MKHAIFSTPRAVLVTLPFLAGSAISAAAEPAVIVLTQVPCQFLESERGRNNGFTSSSSKDCETINAQSGAGRLATSATLQLKPGQYIFRVTNQGVPYELGFWLRPARLVQRVTLPSVSGGGLATGMTKDYAIDLKAGEYLYSCPLNPTPDYKLVVK